MKSVYTLLPFFVLLVLALPTNVAAMSVYQGLKTDSIQPIEDNTASAYLENSTSQTVTQVAINPQIAASDTLSALLQQYLMLKSDKTGPTPRIDTISYLYNQYISQLDYLNDPAIPERHIASDPAYFRLFTPLAYYYAPMEQYSVVEWERECPQAEPSPFNDDQLLPYDNSGQFTRFQRTDAIVNKALLSLYLTNPELIVTTEDNIMGRSSYLGDETPELASDTRVTEVYERKAIVADVGEENLTIRRPNWWTIEGNSSLQLTQTHISDNWYNGGESNFSGLFTFQISANYDDQSKVQFENSLSVKEGITSTSSDTYHDYLFNTDQVKLYNKLGIQAYKNWYYTISSEVTTQIFHGYNSDSETLVSAFLAPLDWTASIGMDYKLSKEKITLSLFLAPITYTLRYVGNSKVDETSYGVDEGKRTDHSLGSQIKPTLKWTITSAITLESTLNFLTSYHWTRVEWENTFNFVINNYLSTKLYVYPRFDDSTRPLDCSYLQLKELLSFGLNFSW